MKLFDTEDESAAPPELATAEQVRELEAFYYRKEAVRRWTREKAETVLRSCKREQRLALRRADALAKEQEGDRGQPSEPERLDAAAFLEQAKAGGVDELCAACAYTLYALTDDEVKRLAAYLVRVYRGELQKQRGAA